MLTATQALNTSRALLFEHPGEECYVYSGGGSALFFTWQRSGYVVTAKHVADKGRDDQVRVCLDDVSNKMFRFDTALSPKGKEQDWKDVAFFRVHRGLLREEWLPHALPLELSLLRAAAASYAQGQPLFVSGYPSSRRPFDYEAGHVTLTRCILQASYDCPDPSGIGKHRIVIDADLDSFDGLSGSPVFAQVAPDSILLAGILIQAAASSGIGHIVGSEALAAMLLQLPAAA